MNGFIGRAGALALALGIGSSLGYGSAAAQQPVAPQETQPQVTLEEAVARALEQSPTLAQSQQAIENAEQSERTAFGSFLPNVNASTGASLRSQDRFDPGTDRIVSGSSDSYNAGLSASYQLYSGGRRYAELDRSRADLRATEARMEDQRFAVTLQTKSFFYDALRQGDLLEVARARVGQAEESLQMVRRQAQVGLATTSDTLRARLEHVNARQAVLQAETATRAARFALGRQIGEDEPVVPIAPSDLEVAPLGVESSAILTEAEERSPSVRAAQAAAGAAEAAVQAARTAYLPTLNLSTGYNWANTDPTFGGGNTSWSLGLSGSYPVFNGFQREANVARASATRRVVNLQEEDARRGARQEADAALRALDTSEQAVGIAGEALAVAEEDLRVVRERYRVGVATILDVVTSQLAIDQARVGLVTARYDHQLARARLEAILGRELR